MKTLSRRDFLKLAGLSLGGLAFRPFFGSGDQLDEGEMVRVASRQVSIYSQPSDKSVILFQRYRDDLMHVYQTIISEAGPGYNPVWYRVWGGYVHSANLQTVKTRINEPLMGLPPKGQLAEVTVPISQAMRKRPYDWEQVYRLYYESTHWITGIEPGPDGELWYQLTDELLGVQYHVPTAHLRAIFPEELTPLSPDVPADSKRIEVSITQQTLTAFEGDKVVLKTKVSTGVPVRRIVPGVIPTDTPKGEFHIQNKMPSKHMGDGHLTSDPEAYEIPGVPWTCFFEPVAGVATHGTYWHTNYGMTMSHGCVNLRPADAKWIFRWSTPIAKAEDWETRGYGTLVRVS
jgi:hypothetical protein